MIPYKTIITLDRSSKQALFLQLSNQIIQLIKEGTLAPRAKLPGSRSLSELLGVHRKTVLASYEELNLQGWIEMLPQKGTFVHSDLPVLHYQNIDEGPHRVERSKTGFSFYENPDLVAVNSSRREGFLYLDDGICDSRLTPTEEIARIYRGLISKKASLSYLSYDSAHGNPQLRTVLANYLNETRGLKITAENVLITRGSQMGINLSAQLTLSEGGHIIVGETNYQSADITFTNTGAQILRVKVDDKGLRTDEIDDLCTRYKVKAIYVTSHHHHPTTVTLSAERRLRLLNLAQKHRFAIIEDDYDYDFHYGHSPILPLAGHDQSGNVIYIGSICKLVAPVFRVGYLVAPKSFVDQCAKTRRYIDRQGDSLLELTFAHFIKNGNLDRHINKVLKIYKDRRDLFCSLLNKELSEFFEFEIPKGGMAVWVKLNKDYNWDDLTKEALNYGLEIGDWRRYDTLNKGHNAIRMGFACFNQEEIIRLVQSLKNSLMQLKRNR